MEHDTDDVRTMRRPHVYVYDGRRIVLESQTWAELQAMDAASTDGQDRRRRSRAGRTAIEHASLTSPPAQCTGPRWPTWVSLPSRAQFDDQLAATYPDALDRAVAVAIVLADRDAWRILAATYVSQGRDESAAARQAAVELERNWRVQRGLERLERPTAAERRAAAQARSDALLAADAGDGRIAATSLDGRVVCTASLRIMPPIPCLVCRRRCAPLVGLCCERCEPMYRSLLKLLEQPPALGLRSWAERWLSEAEFEQWGERAAIREEAARQPRHVAERLAVFDVLNQEVRHDMA